MNFQSQSNEDNLAEIARRSRVTEIDLDLDTGRRFKALGLCIFAGAFSFGMEEAGFEVLGHMELTDCQLGINASRQRWPVYVGNVDQWRDALTGMDKADVIVGNPPCVAYAGTGKHEGTLDTRMCFLRNVAYDTMMVQQPTIWAWELVPGIFSKDLAWLQAMSFRAAKLGYECHAFLTSSALHGGYQDRRRFHFVASRVKIDWEASYASCPPDWKNSKTLGDALFRVRASRWHKERGFEFDDATFGAPGQATGVSDQLGLLPNDETVYKGAFQTLFPHTAPGMHLGHVPDEIMRQVYRPRGTAWTGTGRPGFSHTRGRMDRPSPNVLGGHTIAHPVEDRYLTPRECASVMGFPTDFVFSPGAKAYQEVGRGLCTHNARFLGKAIKDALVNDQPAVVERSGPLRVVDWRNRVRSNSLAMGETKSRDWYFERHGVVAPKGYGTRDTAEEVHEEGG